jgi:hypothetical protein
LPFILPNGKKNIRSGMINPWAADEKIPDKSLRGARVKSLRWWYSQ